MSGLSFDRQRQLVGWQETVFRVVALLWAAFMLWWMSPLPSLVQVLFLDTIKVRSATLGLAFLAVFLVYPRSQMQRGHAATPADLLLATAGVFATFYLSFFFEEISARLNAPTARDLAVGCLGLLVTLEAVRRSVALPVMLIAVFFIALALFGPDLREVAGHKGGSLEEAIAHL